MTRGSFVNVKCHDCGNEQVVFNKPAEDINCTACDAVIAESTGGTARLHADVLNTVEG